VYIIKVKGKAKIPDYIQLRDENFVLIAYFRADRSRTCTATGWKARKCR
jgi:hypothetical protein